MAEAVETPRTVGMHESWAGMAMVDPKRTPYARPVAVLNLYDKWDLWHPHDRRPWRRGVDWDTAVDWVTGTTREPAPRTRDTEEPTP